MMRYDRRAVRRLRMERGLSVGELALRARLSPRTTAYLDHGTTVPRADTLAKLSHALEVPVTAFFVRKDPGKAA